jgi:DNA-directed RNA polymerase specialized sigma24 family protein
MKIDEKLCEYATDRQAEAIRAYLSHGTYAQAAKTLGIDESSCTNLIKRAKRRAAIFLHVQYAAKKIQNNSANGY